MSELSVEDRVILVLENLVVQGTTITRDSTWNELDLDSLMKIEFLMDLEDEFHIYIPDEVMEYLDNVGEAIDYVKRIAKL